MRGGDILRSSPQLILRLMLFFFIKVEDSGRGWRKKERFTILKVFG